MTKRRDFKTLVRERMKKTGERYQTARIHVLASRDHSQPATEPGIKGYGPCGGIQSETSTLRNVVRAIGVRGPDGQPLTEELIFGLCGGIGFLYAVFEYKGHPPMLTIVGRAKSMPDTFLAGGLERFGCEVNISETASANKARTELERALESETPALCTVDAASLPHHGLPAEMCGMGPHVVAVIGRGEGDTLLVDDRGAEPIAVDASAFAEARKSYRAGKHRLVTLTPSSAAYDLPAALRDGLRYAARAYDEPPAKPFASNVGTAGLRKWARLLSESADKKSWTTVFEDGARAYVGLRRAYDCTQHDYTAPNASRPMFADTLDQAEALTGLKGLSDIAAQFREIGDSWAELASVIIACDETVARGCALSDRRAELVDTSGKDAAKEMQTLYGERQTLAESCTITASVAADTYNVLGELVSSIADRERAAMDQLARIVA